MKLSPFTLSIFFSILSSICYTATLLLAKLADPFSPQQILFFRSFVVFLLMLLALPILKRPLSLRKYLYSPFIKIHMIRSCTAVVSLYLFIWAIKRIPLTEVALLSNTLPLFTPFIARIWDKTPIDHRLWPSLLISFAGILYLTKPELSGEWLGTLAAITGALLSAIAFIAFRVASYSESVSKTILYYTFFSSVITGIPYYYQGIDWSILQDLSSLLLLLGIGIFALLYQLFFACALKWGPIKLVGPLTYVSVLLSLSLDILIWHRSLLQTETLGVALLAIGLTLTIWQTRQKATT